MHIRNDALEGALTSNGWSYKAYPVVQPCLCSECLFWHEPHISTTKKKSCCNRSSSSFGEPTYEYEGCLRGVKRSQTSGDEDE